MNSNITVIIPVHSVAGDFDKLFKEALDSIRNNSVKPEKVLVIRCKCKDVIQRLSDLESQGYFEGLNVSVVENPNTKDFPSQINTAVDLVETEFFSILEFDDVYSGIWFKNFKEYNSRLPKVGIFLPITVESLYGENKSIGLTNASPLSKFYGDKTGYLTYDILENTPNFSISGAVIRKKDFIDSGKIKTNIKLSFIYEFLLRFAYSGRDIYVIPKIGYKHTVDRPNSLFWNYKNGLNDKISIEEGKYWMEVAKKEYINPHQREINTFTNS